MFLNIQIVKNWQKIPNMYLERVESVANACFECSALVKQCSFSLRIPHRLPSIKCKQGNFSQLVLAQLPTAICTSWPVKERVLATIFIKKIQGLLLIKFKITAPT